MSSSFVNLRILLGLLLIVVCYNLLAPHYYADLSKWLTPWTPLLAALPYLLTGVIWLISWHFHNHKPAFTALLISLLNAWLQSPLQQEAVWGWSLLILLPIEILLLAKLPARPLLSRAALSQLLLLAVPALLMFSLYHFAQSRYLFWLTYEPKLLQSYSYLLPYPALILLVQAVVLISLLVLILRDRQQQDVYLLITASLLSWLIYAPIPQLEHWLWISFLLALWLMAILVYGHNLAYLDELTGLPGRRALNQARSNMGRRHVIAMLDVDHFKQFNDSYGHDVGDQVLRMVAARIKQVRGGTAYRYGGEEFCVLFPATRMDAAIPAAEEIRQAVEEAKLQIRSRHRPRNQRKGHKLRGSGPGKDTCSVSVTISIGLAEHGGSEDTLKAADKKLYQAKQQGRNQVCY